MIGLKATATDIYESNEQNKYTNKLEYLSTKCDCVLFLVLL